MKRTKQLIVKAFEELLEERSLNRITVKDIVERCQVNRNTFYYYFRDIPALVEETTHAEVDNIISRSNVTFRSPMECIRPIVEYCTERKKLVLHIYNGTSRERFQQELKRSCRYTVERYFETAGEWQKVNERDRELLLRYYCALVMGLVLDWLDSGMGYDAVADMGRLCTLMSGTTEQAIRNSLANPE